MFHHAHSQENLVSHNNFLFPKLHPCPSLHCSALDNAKVTPYTALPEAEATWRSQPLLMHNLLQHPGRLGGPLLDLLQYGSLSLGSPKLGTVLQVLFQKC